MNLKAKYILLSLSAAQLISCTPKSVPVTEHERAPQNTVQPPKMVEESNELSLKEALQVFGKMSSQELIKKSDRLAEEVLSDQILRDPTQKDSMALRLKLQTLNQTLISAFVKDASATMASSGWKTYREKALAGCGAKEMDECQNLRFLRKDVARSSMVLQLGARQISASVADAKKAGDAKCEKPECNQQLRDLYRLLIMARMLHGRLPNKDLDLLYVTHWFEYVRWLQTQKDPVSRSLVERQQIELSGIFKTFDDIPKDNPSLKEFLKGFNPWQFSRARDNELSSELTVQIFRFAAKNLLYENNKLNAELKKTIMEDQKAELQGDLTFTQIVNTIMKGDEKKKIPATPTLFKGLGLDDGHMLDSSFFDEHFYIVDRLYRGDLGLGEAAQIWQAVRGEDRQKRFLQTAQDYMRVRMVHMISETNAYMSEVYAKKIAPNDLAFKAISESGVLTIRWGQMIEKFNTIMTFVGSNFVDDKIDTLSARQTQDLLQSLKQNIKFSSVYPHMLLLMYFMEDKKASLTFNTWFGPVTIDVAVLIEALFDGKMGPWFNFGTDEVGLNRFQMIYAYYFALYTGTFEAFGVRKDDEGNPAVDRRQFFIKVMRKYLTQDLDSIEQAYRDMARKTASGNSREFQRVCSYLRRDSNDFSINIPLSDLKDYVSVGANANGTAKLANDYYGGYDSARAKIANLRGDVRMKEIYIRNMVEVLYGNYEFLLNITPAGSPEYERLNKEYAATKVEVDKTMNQLSSAKQKLFDEVINQHRNLSDCANKMADVERTMVQKQLVEEYNYLAQVYDNLLGLEGLKDQQLTDRLAALNKAPELGTRDTYQQGSYNYSQLGFYLRVRDRLAASKPQVMVTLPGTTADDLKRLDYFSRFVELRLQGPNGVLSREEFIALGMKMLNGLDSSYANWIQRAYDVETLSNKVKTIMEIYRAGKELALDNPQVPTAAEIVNEIVRIPELVNLSEGEAKILRTMGLNGKVEKKTLKGIFMNENNTDTYLPVDSFYVSLRDNAQSYAMDKSLFDAITTQGLFLFKPATNVPERLRTTYRALLTRHESMMGEFEKAVTEKEKQSVDANRKIVYEVTTDANGNIVPVTVYNLPTASGAPVYFNRRNKEIYQESLDSYHKNQTQYFFKPHKGDAECNLTEGVDTTYCNEALEFGGSW